MPGTKIGGIRAGQKNKQKTIMKINGEYVRIEPGTFYEHIGALGGEKSRGGGFAANRELAKTAGRQGGLKSRRTKVAE